jgi:hypothetical protein
MGPPGWTSLPGLPGYCHMNPRSHPSEAACPTIRRRQHSEDVVPASAGWVYAASERRTTGLLLRAPQVKADKLQQVIIAHRR